QKKQGKEINGVAPQALALLMQYDWPGNVRELESEIERAVALTPSGEAIAPSALSERLKTHRSLQVPLASNGHSLRQARLAFEREFIADVLRQHQGNAVRTAKALGISRQMLQKKIKDYGLRDRSE
ncbi:MAG TPA: helix-turn-helix domain-containing protein, partial [Methylomirabilota bacterium]|nr:helix-turn-helix domain-containing protein [Methylomirabilota bacterium]